MSAELLRGSARAAPRHLLRSEEFQRRSKQLESGELDADQRTATITLLAEILFPNADEKGLPGLDLTDAEAIAPSQNLEAREVLSRMDEEEANFAKRLRQLMEAKGLTQAQLADAVGDWSAGRVDDTESLLSSTTEDRSTFCGGARRIP